MSSMDLELSLPVAFYYETSKPLPIPDVIRALSALQKMSSGLPAFFSTLSGAKIDDCVLKVEKVESGSLKEYLELVLKFLSAAEKEKFEKWLMTTKLGTAARYTAVAGIASLAIMVLASSFVTLADKLSGQSAPSIKANNSIVLSAGGDIYNVSLPVLEKAVKAAGSKNRRQMAAAALDFVKPASGQNGGAIYAGEDPTSPVKISHEAATDAPDSLSVETPEQDIPYKDVSIDIRNVNRDSESSGWLGYAQSIAPNKKLPISFASGIDLTAAKTDQFIVADIIVTYSIKPNTGDLVPKSMQVTSIK